MSTKKESKIASAAKGRTSGVADSGATQLSAVSANELHSFILGALAHGALVSFSGTRDGSATVLTILHDELPGGKYKEYCDEQKLADEIQYWMGVFAD